MVSNTSHCIGRDGWEGLCCLVHGYEIVGATPQLIDTLIRLVDTDEARLVPGGIDALAQRLNRYASASDEAHRALDTLRAQTGAAREDDRDALDIGTEGESHVLDRLLQHGFLTKREYVSLIETLAAPPDNEAKHPVSALHLLRDQGHRTLMEACCFLSEDAGVPLLPLSAYPAQSTIAAQVPPDFALHRGCLPFAQLDQDLLVAVLNPYQRSLFCAASEAAGRRCHPFLVMPHEYDHYLEQLDQGIWARIEKP